ncbi:MAG: hypothetical protein JF603_02425 [Acidobacteria bacterium]|nr:hypothetical protein [Acidobacteriota bacterium]
MTTTPAAETIDKATAATATYAAGLKAASDQVLATTQKTSELAFDLAKSFINIAVEVAPKFATAPYVPSKKDIQDLLSASFAPVEKAVAMQRAAATALLDATGVVKA